MKTLIITLATVLFLTSQLVNAMTPPAKSLFVKTQVKEIIDNQLNYNPEANALHSEGTVEVTIEVSDNNQLHVTYIDGNAELSEYVQANIDNLKFDNPLVVGNTFDFELKFEK